MGSRGCHRTTADTCVENPMAGAGTEGVGVSEKEAACSLAPRYTQSTRTVLTHNAEKPITLILPSPHPVRGSPGPTGTLSAREPQAHDANYKLAWCLKFSLLYLSSIAL